MVCLAGLAMAERTYIIKGGYFVLPPFFLLFFYFVFVCYHLVFLPESASFVSLR